ncbi:MAG: DHH family phosphoesterase [Bdellovibrionota bacterium]
MNKLVAAINQHSRILLTTHRQCDGDGLGAELAVFHALKKINKQVRVINIDETPKKYGFLNPDSHITYFDQNPNIDIPETLCLVFDTNDERLVEPLFSRLQDLKCQTIFIDHHPVLTVGPQPSADSFINTAAASTGEIAFDLIKKLNIPLDIEIARAVYTSVTFDTQLYRFIRNSPRSHEIAAEVLKFPIDPQTIHRGLFGQQTPLKMKFLATMMGKVDYFFDDRLAVLHITESELAAHKLSLEDARDVIDMMMNIECLEVAVVLREDSPGRFKMSFRSKGMFQVLPLAEAMGGGGHLFSAGASITSDLATLKLQIMQSMQPLFKTA